MGLRGAGEFGERMIFHWGSSSGRSWRAMAAVFMLLAGQFRGNLSLGEQIPFSSGYG